ncbi:uncharacterized protein BDV17DRAFT_294242 [Aspergillus undulatus]|uniref:uncharacterized protein n=1 Tax=Aspergillus undulatus TaxID=1810928 RepID=UPI003CCDB921
MSPTSSNPRIANMIRVHEEGFKSVGQETAGLAVCTKTGHLYESFGTATEVLVLPVLACIVPEGAESTGLLKPVTVKDIARACEKLNERIMRDPPVFGDFVEYGFWIDEGGWLKVGRGEMIKLDTQPSCLSIVRPLDDTE